MTDRVRITLAEAQDRMNAQGMTDRNDIAFVCPICGTVQSMASLIKAGAEPESVERVIGFSCEGRWRHAGPWHPDPNKRRHGDRRGCDWSLGGLFQLHRLEIEYPDGAVRPNFEIATAEQAEALKASL